MLILIAGITGLTGLPCARAAIQAGRQVRGLGRDQDKVPRDVNDRLESFVKIESIYDLQALDRAVRGVDAIISAMNSSPEVIVEGQLLLLRAAERASVKIFHASTWNYDWTNNKLGDHENYDAFITFHNHARTSSTINPIHAFVGCIPEFLFKIPHSNPLNKMEKTLSYFGTGKEIWRMTPLEDLAAFTLQAISEPDAEKGGFYRVESFHCTIAEMANVYSQVHGVEIQLKHLGSVEDVEKMLAEARATTEPTNWYKYVGLAYASLWLRGVFDYEPVDSQGRWNHIKRTGMVEWFEKNRDI